MNNVDNIKVKEKTINSSDKNLGLDKTLFGLNIFLFIVGSLIILITFLVGVVELNGEKINIIFIMKIIINCLQFNHSYLLFAVTSIIQILLYLVFLFDMIRNLFYNWSCIKEKMVYPLQKNFFRFIKNMSFYFIIASILNTVNLTTFACVGFIIGLIIIAVTTITGYIVYKNNIDAKDITIKNLVFNEIDLFIKTIALLFLLREFVYAVIPTLINGIIYTFNLDGVSLLDFVIIVYNNVVVVCFEVVVIILMIIAINENSKFDSIVKTLKIYLIVHTGVKIIISYASYGLAGFDFLENSLEKFYISLVPLVLLAEAATLSNSPLKRYIKFPSEFGKELFSK